MLEETPLIISSEVSSDLNQFSQVWNKQIY